MTKILRRIFKNSYFLLRNNRKEIEKLNERLIQRVFEQLQSLQDSNVITELKTLPVQFVSQQVEKIMYDYLKSKKLTGRYLVSDQQLRQLAGKLTYSFEAKLDKAIRDSGQWNIV